ncbi:MAG: hypothetical protein R2689_08270 [Microthrixaceae bacterium]
MNPNSQFVDLLQRIVRVDRRVAEAFVIVDSPFFGGWADRTVEQLGNQPLHLLYRHSSVNPATMKTAGVVVGKGRDVDGRWNLRNLGHSGLALHATTCSMF